MTGSSIQRTYTSTEQIEELWEDIDPEVIKAGQYLVLKDEQRTVEEIAEFFGYRSRQTIYNMVQRWEESGALKKAREMYLLPKSEEIKATYSLVLNNWPMVIKRVLRTAMNSKSDKTSLEAAAWLKSQIVDPELAAKQDPGSAEAAYADRPTDAPPTTIVMPGFIKKLERIE